MSVDEVNLRKPLEADTAPFVGAVIPPLIQMPISKMIDEILFAIEA